MQTFADARRALERNETSCSALVSSFLARIAAHADLNIFTHVDAEAARARAEALDAERAAGTDRPLAGLMLSVKDVIAQQGRPLTCASRMLDGFRSLYDATAVARLEAAGAIVLGRTNCDAFAMGSTNEHSHYGPVQNPAAPGYVPGGSSGGAAASVAAGLCHVALGTDTGGSIRQPAAFCGVVGLKPTYGRVSRYGLVAFASSFDCMGPLAHTVEDAARVLRVMAGADPHDATSAPVPVPDYAAACSGDPAAVLRGLRVGLPDAYYADGLDDGIRGLLDAHVERLRAAGADVRTVAMPHTHYGVATYYILSAAEASSNLGRYDGLRFGHRADADGLRREMQAEQQRLRAALSAAEARGDAKEASVLREQLSEQDTMLRRLYTASRTEGFGDEVKRRIMLGTYVLSSGYYDAYYGKAQRVRTLVRRDFDAAFDAVDVLLTPVTPTPPYPLGSKTDDPLARYLGDVYTVTANLAGVPGLALPLGRHPDAPHLPVGMQLLGRPFEEAALLRVGAAMEAMQADGRNERVN